MPRWRNNGGWNRRCGTVEATPQVDSYDLAQGWGNAFCGGKLIDTYHDPAYGECSLLLPGREEPVEIATSSKRNGFGGSQAFFLCPACGGRARYLYQTGADFLCRKCAQLNYRSQQATRSGSMYFYRKGVALAEKHLGTWLHPDGFSFCGWLPERPRYMHQTTYRKYLARFLRYRKKHADRQMADMLKLLEMFK
ncbi:MAG: hypothetical protein K2P20_06545 [Oscillospiraceae bacterium]|nr:hypothetical protein [Oscillospiraceae bacterium]